MKRLLIFLILATASWPLEATDTWVSSFTATADTTKNVCGADRGIVTNKRGFFHGVCVSSASVGGVYTVYNSSASAINPLAVIDTTTKGCYYYDVVASTQAKGLTYSNSSTANVTLLFNCY